MSRTLQQFTLPTFKKIMLWILKNALIIIMQIQDPNEGGAHVLASSTNEIFKIIPIKNV